MADFINTSDVVGAIVLEDSIVDRSVTEFRDNKVTYIGQYAFCGCDALTTVDIPMVTSIDDYAFWKCTNLSVLILRNTAGVVSIYEYSYALYSTAIASGNGYIYVPAALVDSYKVTSRWQNYANQFRALESYTVDGTITGALDTSKI